MNLDRALRDAAEPVPPRVTQPGAQALLDRIVAVPPPVPADVDRARAGWRPRKAVIALLAAVVAALAAAVPHLGSSPAYASWTPQPSPLAAADRDELADRCAARVAAEYAPGEAAPATRVAHGERRGDYAYVSVVTPGWSALCLRDGDGDLHRPSIMMDPVTAATLGGAGVELQGWPQLRTGEGYCRLMSGHVGSQVTGVDIVVRGGSGDHSRTVRATVEDGFFLAWYPEARDDANTNRTTLTLRLADGGTVEGLSAGDLLEAPRLK